MSRHLIALVMAAIACVLVGLPTSVRADDATKICIIVHKDNKETPALADIKDIFLKKKTTWADKTEIQPCQQSSDSAEAKAMRENVLGLDEKDLAKHWADMRQNKGIEEPITKNKDKLVYKFVKETKAAIGYVSKKYLDDDVGKDVYEKDIKIISTH